MFYRVSEFHFFLRLNNTALYVETTFRLFMHLSVDFWLFPSLTIESNTAVNMVAEYLCESWVSVGHTRCGIAGAYDYFMFNFLRNSYAVFYKNCTILHSH